MNIELNDYLIGIITGVGGISSRDGAERSFSGLLNSQALTNTCRSY